MKRKDVASNNIIAAMKEIELALKYRIEQKGKGTLVSLNEIHGMIDQEVRELKEEFHSRNLEKIICELGDLSVACVFALACLFNESVEGVDYNHEVYNV